MRKSKRVLILGDLESIYIKGFITRFLKPCGFIVDVKTDMSTPKRREKCEKLAKSLDVKIIEKNEQQIIYSLSQMQKNKVVKPIASTLKGVLYSCYKLQAKIRGEYDYVHVHYLYYEVLRNAWRYKTPNNRIIASWWGSDLLRKDDDELEKCWRYLKNYDLVTADSIDLEKAYFSRVVKGRKSDSKYQRLYLGSEVADCINYQIDNAERIIQNKIIDDDKIIIAIGYNASRAQQHINVIDELDKLSPKIKEHILLILQMTYGVDDASYVATVVEAAAKAGYKILYFDKYLTNEEVASIRICSDIFINAQTTDAFCSTVKEYMYAKTILVNASWLEYAEFDEWGIKTDVFNEFCEIPAIIEKNITSKNNEFLEKNREIIGKRFSWDECSKKWIEAYEEI